ATNLNLEEEVQAGRFREDLYYRLQVIPVHIPPLRERTSDIPLLGHHFLKKCGEALGKNFDGFSKEALARLSTYQWPGNVRELENVIERAAVLAAGRRIEADDIVIKGLREVKGIEAGMTMEEVQRILLEKTLRACEGNKTRAAETMDVSLSWVHYKVKEWNIDA
ncbi:MAG: sigma-54-dependent Fis family transcriptional regulator, partial [Calditrichaeota bacterium]|nr:sigma-54-dependent Fis family transcriptional regulator [Calditrichota bacterium]